MKHFLLTLLIAIVCAMGQAQTIHWKIEGTVANAEPTDTLTLIDIEEQREIGKLQVADGRIADMSIYGVTAIPHTISPPTAPSSPVASVARPWRRNSPRCSGKIDNTKK